MSVRELAALICAVKASNYIPGRGRPGSDLIMESFGFGAHDAPYDLTFDAIESLGADGPSRSDDDASARWAEAEALLRTGWEPGQ